ncbi:hypothetical protein [Natronoarchaeum rubrum]|uniref:hypothetical protein n=1 Tax=Natronoarchaeum rubrum TaxID=755311 RepID=UPI0021110C05|nr:hypothetical protein [Natronoarchaeum rubrum]
MASVVPVIGVRGPVLFVLLLLLVISVGLAYWVYVDARFRDDEYAASWAITVFLTSLFYLFPGLVVIGLYREVRA